MLRNVAGKYVSLYTLPHNKDTVSQDFELLGKYCTFVIKIFALAAKASFRTPELHSF
jgi:hypothetical protein